MFRYSYDEMDGDTVIFEREIIHPNISKWLKVINFIGENRKGIAIAAVLFLVSVVALVLSLVLTTNGSNAVLNVDSHEEIVTEGQRRRPKEVSELPLPPSGEESGENTRISIQGESTDSHRTAVIQTDGLSNDASGSSQETSSKEPEVSCQLKRRPLPDDWAEKSPISVLHEVEQDPPEFKFERCNGVVFGSSVKIKCENLTFGPAYSRKKSGGKGSAKELAAKLAVEALYNVSYTPDSDTPSIITAKSCKKID